MPLGNATLFEWGIIGVLAGIALGLRYKVVILIPAVALVMTFAMMVGIGHDDHIWSIALAMAISGATVQLGYFAGIVIRAAAG